MPIRVARVSASYRPRQIGCRVGLAALLLTIGCEGLQPAIANGDTRTIALYNTHTGENLTVTYKRNGRYDDDALNKLNHILRDWRRNEVIRMDPKVIDVVWEVNRDAGGKEAIRIICGYRAPATNSMLRRRSRGVAQFSQHTLGKAIDFHLPGVPLDEIRAAGLRLQKGGVGFYPGSQFVHVDIGSVRHWPRMTRDQLAKVFPNGRTIHVPTDGKPMSGYALAQADIEKRGPGGSSAGTPFGALAKIFGGGKDEQEDTEQATAPTRATTPASRTTTVASADTAAAKPDRVAAATPVPLPQARPAALMAAAAPKAAPTTPAAQAAPAGGFVLASATSQAAPTPPVRTAPDAIASLSPNQIINERGFWDGVTDTENSPLARRVRERVEAASATGSFGDATDSPRRERSPTDFVMAYAAEASFSSSSSRAAPMGAAASSQPADTTVAVKGVGVKPPAPRPQATTTAPARPVAAKPGERFDNPWLRVVFWAPSAQTAMTTTVQGMGDARLLKPLMTKPPATVLTTFSERPYFGLSIDQFAGNAIAFVPTVTFNALAALQ